MADVEGRVLIAPDDSPLEPDPTWERMDDIDNFVADIQITAGKQTEFDQSQTNTATVRFNDTAGLLDPNNPSSPWYGNLYGKQILCQVYNPVEDAWFSRFRGTTKRPRYDLNPATRNGVSILSNAAIECVGVFDYLARYQQTPGINGDTPPAAAAGSVFWEDGEVNDRIISMLASAGLDSTRYVVFDGNVLVIETLYDPGDPILIGLRDASDAESPVAYVLYEDRFGRAVWHGRQSITDPDTVAAGAGATAWDFQRYKIGDGAAIIGDSDYAQIRPPFQYSVPLERIVNAALITPRRLSNATPFDRTTIPSLVVSDSGSIGAYGVVPFARGDSINGGHKTNGDNAAEDCKRSAQFLVDNFKDALIRIDAATVKAISPDDPRAEPVWNILSRADIADVTETNLGYPGGVGVGQNDFIQGWTQTITPLNPDYDYVELGLNLSPTPSDATAYDD